MSRFRHYSAAPSDDQRKEEEESSDDDAFSALARKRPRTKRPLAQEDRLCTEGANPSKESVGDDGQRPVAQTSSNKRHHGAASDGRQAKMEAILLELEAEALRNKSGNEKPQRRTHPRTGGSFVDPGDEHCTTNIFVGNLAPSITEEQMTELFRQFGDLYSVKIMWPRSPEERTRNRHTGFVCFMNRRDAEDAMEACQDKDPFRVGRPLTMSWGKHVRKEMSNPIVKRGTGGTLVVRDNAFVADTLRSTLQQHPSLVVDAKHAIHVVIPANRERANWISTVASFVAKDGAQFEQLLLQQHEPNDPHWNFLSPALFLSNDTLRQEHAFYKWRVYAFCQGDGASSWNTAPFVMIQPNGCTWYPPPLDLTAAQRETEERRNKEESIRSLKEQRRLTKRDRPIELARRSDSARLTESELAEMHRLFQEKLSLSRESICRAMAFCFEKSGAAVQIADAMKELLWHPAPGTSVETISARLYLMSDILFNSQQPGIRNAFLYRDAIEKMSPEVLRELGVFVRTQFGRLSQERIGTAVNGIFAAWTQWGVFDLSYINDLEAHYEGREIRTRLDVLKPAPTSVNDLVVVEETVGAIDTIEDKAPRGDWICISGDIETNDNVLSTAHPSNKESKDAFLVERDLDGDALDVKDNSPRHHPLNHDTDDVDGVPFDENDLDGAACAEHTLPDDDVDGVPLDDDDLDGEPLDDFVPVTKSPLNEVESSLTDENDLNGEPVDDDIAPKPSLNDLDGSPIDENDIDGEALDT